ncbi:molybdate transport system substrate-binding protein [Microbacterium sp. BE35]|uniref:substrate-binding domain-containing protein n=1 Tax=Microbacterium sp. BE35 TaxID=2817773 RepID=UPI00285F8801|nr:substrate-binding domain-containing protein [Microbacterium sp. BE35]MDR7188236.1 molybdate transport system substrate-binding protein [Microbacterium sp. BE35]
MSSITLFSTLAVRKALETTVLPAFTDATGIEVRTVFDPTTQLFRRIRSQERFDVIVAITESLHELDGGTLDRRTVTPIASTQVGIAVGPHARIPDISDEAHLIETLLAARSVAYSRTGASGIYFAQLIKDLGIARQLNSRATVLEKGFTATALLDDRADLAVQQMSELLFVPEAKIVGPLPRSVRHVTQFSAGVSPLATHDVNATALLRHLTSPAAHEAYEAAHLEPAGSSI